MCWEIHRRRELNSVLVIRLKIVPEEQGKTERTRSTPGDPPKAAAAAAEAEAPMLRGMMSMGLNRGPSP